MADPIKIEIDGHEFETQPGTMIIQVADEAGIDIPRFCYHKKLSIAANCRMCLVQVEKAPKPLPACATPVTDGMKVFTSSDYAEDAQKATMEFLLINHPLDCPICDQGGECPLQDQAVVYGNDVSRFAEKKRVVDDQDIGPLIATEMTRCIHCTRCVRFGQEVAGIMELGATGRGEHTQIGAYIGQTVDSELSGNAIDLCPVGALTSKPYRFSARAWELVNHDGISPHDCVGTNLNIQTLRNQVKRILPRDNEAINECWIADRDRYSYEALNSSERLTVPMIKHGGEWQETDWQSALNFAVEGLRGVIEKHGAGGIGALASPISTTEEFYLLQKLFRSLGSGNVDHRLRQIDFSDDENAPVFPGIEIPIAELETRKAILLIGSNIRKDQPLLGLRVRKAALKGAHIMAINPLDYQFHFKTSAKSIVASSQLIASLARVASSLAQSKSIDVPPEISTWVGDADVNHTETSIADTLTEQGGDALVLLGSVALQHPDFSTLKAISQWIVDTCGAKLGHLADANSAGACLAGCVPYRGALGSGEAVKGKSLDMMLDEPCKAYVLFGTEPELDCTRGLAASNALREAEFVVSISAFRGNMEFSDMLLPMTPFTETSGTFVNCEGKVQSFQAAVTPKGESRPGWKILRVLGNLFNCDGFDQVSSQDVLAEMQLTEQQPVSLRPQILKIPSPTATENSNGEVERIVDTPLYAVDPIVRRSAPLQATKDNPTVAMHINRESLTALNLPNDKATVSVNGHDVSLHTVEDDRVPAGSVYIPAGYADTRDLDGAPSVKVSNTS